MLIQRFLELVIIIDPFGVIPFLVASTAIPDHFKLKYARLASIALFIGGTLFTIFGASVLNAFAVSLAAFTLVSGLVLTIVGFNLMQLTPTKLKNDDTTATLPKQLWLIPITFPMLLGPAPVPCVRVLSGAFPINTVDILCNHQSVQFALKLINVV